MLEGAYPGDSDDRYGACVTPLTANGVQGAPWWGVPVLAGCFTVGVPFSL
jgi:hypothetical protein